MKASTQEEDLCRFISLNLLLKLQRARNVRKRNISHECVSQLKYLLMVREPRGMGDLSEEDLLSIDNQKIRWQTVNTL